MSRSQERYQASLPLLNTNLVHPNNQHLNDDDDDDDITPTTATGPIRTSYPPSFADSSPKQTHDPLPYTARIPPSSSRTHSSSRPISYGIEHELEPYRDDANSPWDPRPPLERDGSSFPRIDYTRSISPNPPTVVAGRGIKSMVSSRELEYDLDDNDLPPASPSSTASDRTLHASSQHSPLLVGLLTARRSLDTSLPSSSSNVDASPIPDWLAQGGGMLATVANLANSIAGAGVLGLPYALGSAGMWTGTFLLVVMGWITDWTIRLIVLNAKLSGRNSYIEIMGQCFGESGRIGVSFFQFAFAFGGMCAFGVIIGDTIPHVLAFVFPFLRTTPILSLLVNRQSVILLASLLVSYPLSLHRDISKLSKASGVALISMLIIVLSVLIDGSRLDDPALRGDPALRFTVIRPRVFEAIGVISFAYVCHHNTLLIYGSLKTPTMDRFAKVTHISTFISVVVCLVMALSGYLVFTDKTQANVLNNFPQEDFLINVARLCFGLNMFTTLPLEAFVCREVIESYFYPTSPFSQTRHVVITTVIVASTTLISLLTCDLGIVLELTGGLSATVLAFIFPAICFLKLSDAPALSRTKLPAWACATFGLVVLVLSLALSVLKAFRGGGEKVVCS